MKTITTISELIAVISNAPKGQWATITYNANIRLNKYPLGVTDKSCRLDDNFSASRIVRTQCHIGQSYPRACEKLGKSVSNEKNENKLYLGGGVSYNTSTGSVLLGFMPARHLKTDSSYFVNGKKATDEDIEKINLYRAKTTSCSKDAVNFRSIKVTDIKTISINGCSYKIEITDLSEIKRA